MVPLVVFCLIIKIPSIFTFCFLHVFNNIFICFKLKSRVILFKTMHKNLLNSFPNILPHKKDSNIIKETEIEI